MMKWVQGKQDNLKIDNTKHERHKPDDKLKGKAKNQAAMRSFVRRSSKGR